ncbi:MAG: D-alanyl-D-alanine carboxypeptidase family protein [Lachnospiraceae bacterium]|nr:D-alanyl-D-alanine carboxypeptidase family protein [Lachnospiraceae bacterium]
MKKMLRKLFGFIKLVIVLFISGFILFGIAVWGYDILSGKLAVGEHYTWKDVDYSDEEKWSLILVNPWNPVPDGYEVELTELKNGEAVDSRIYPLLQEMFDDARKEGIRPFIYSSYRTQAYQQYLYDKEIEDYKAQGYNDEEAEAIAKTWVAYPGTSEHQLGLALDITSEDKNKQPAEKVWQWLELNSYKYGFILRYTEEKMEFTGINPEPWHYRYVGKKAAKEIYEQGICLEEYLENKK